jgi:hypothetical protein
MINEFDPEELPTSPEAPAPKARKCRHCSKVYGDHAQTAQPQTQDVCRGTRQGFKEEDHSDDERKR